MKNILEDSSIPTIVKNALNRKVEKYEELSPLDLFDPSKTAKDAVTKMEMSIDMLRRNNQGLSFRNDELVNKLKELENQIKFLKEDNAILRSLVRKQRRSNL